MKTRQFEWGSHMSQQQCHQALAADDTAGVQGGLADAAQLLNVQEQLHADAVAQVHRELSSGDPVCCSGR